MSRPAPAPVRASAPAHTPAPTDRREPGEVFGPAFTLFADVLLVSLLTSLCCLPVLTAPAAFAAASATLRETAAGGRSASARAYLVRLRARLVPRSLLLGLLVPAFVVAVRADLALAGGDLPGRALVGPALVVLALGAGVLLLRASAAPGPVTARTAWQRAAADPHGSLLLVAALVLAALIAWSMPLLLPLLPGPLAFAATAVDLRAAPRSES
ncbi:MULTISPECIES: hypothetical protein [unclassified Streptomyces]|uniref:hypothetical protein n=1 Tax=unclassified Streptomyces TaxID=2593676 RepID=UPI0001B559DD|nr:MULTISPECIES: hypothetical protein [unclassified Streptomyces]EFL03278.1 predicted protein [Streptomyces sp. SPB78]MYR26846.1 hypothetical protein [Streptomyces sp. SID4945]SCE10212.1 hypothetical protein GA0115251_141616 [Streptomyces sp. TverLS-915]SCF12494.1 hypothetical protein GA0115257_107218 [Streptomyces sp. LcepLS]